MTNKRRVEEVVTGMVMPIIEKCKFELVDVSFLKEGNNWYLRVFIDKPGGVTLDDCQLVSEELGDKLDEAEIIDHSYFLEVSSPGLDRPLKTERDFQRYRGEIVEVKLYKPVEGKKLFEGKLEGMKDGRICIRLGDDSVLEFEKNQVALVKRAIKL